MKCSVKINNQPIRPKNFLFSTEKLDGETEAPSPSIDRSLTPLNMAAGVVFALSLILVVGHLQEGPGSLAKTFTFPEYPYKETTKNVSHLYKSSKSFFTEWYVLNADTGYEEQSSLRGGNFTMLALTLPKPDCTIFELNS